MHAGASETLDLRDQGRVVPVGKSDSLVRVEGSPTQSTAIWQQFSVSGKPRHCKHKLDPNYLVTK